MRVKLRDDISLDYFIKLTFGVKGCEIVNYTEYFDNKGIRSICEAYKDVYENLVVLIPQADGSLIDMTFEPKECWMWEEISK